MKLPHESPPRASSPACSRPATCTSATISAPWCAGSRCRRATSASIAWSTCTRSPCGRIPRSSRSPIRSVTAAYIAAGLDPKQQHPVQPEPGAGARGAGLDLQLRGPARLAEPHDAVQGEGRQGSRERLRRSLRLSELMAADILAYRATHVPSARTRSSTWSSPATSPRSSTTISRRSIRLGFEDGFPSSPSSWAPRRAS